MKFSLYRNKLSKIQFSREEAQLKIRNCYTHIYIYLETFRYHRPRRSRWLSLSQTFISPRTEDLSLTSILLSHDVNTHSHLSNCTTRSARWHLDTRSIRKISIREQLPPCVSIFRQGKLFTAEKIGT